MTIRPSGANAIEYVDLPLQGTLNVMIPDTPENRDRLTYQFNLYIIDSDTFPLAADDTAYISLDKDLHLNCETGMELSTENASRTVLPGDVVNVIWDSCGNENTLLRVALEQGEVDDRTTTFEEFIPVESSGSQVLTAPDQPGRFYVELYYVNGDDRYMLQSRLVFVRQP